MEDMEKHEEHKKSNKHPRNEQPVLTDEEKLAPLLFSLKDHSTTLTKTQPLEATELRMDVSVPINGG